MDLYWLCSGFSFLYIHSRQELGEFWLKSFQQQKERHGNCISWVPNMLYKVKGFIAVILSWSISLITDLQIHAWWSVSTYRPLCLSKKERVASVHLPSFDPLIGESGITGKGNSKSKHSICLATDLSNNWCRRRSQATIVKLVRKPTDYEASGTRRLLSFVLNSRQEMFEHMQQVGSWWVEWGGR